MQETYLIKKICYNNHYYKQPNKNIIKYFCTSWRIKNRNVLKLNAITININTLILEKYTENLF